MNTQIPSYLQVSDCVPYSSGIRTGSESVPALADDHVKTMKTWILAYSGTHLDTKKPELLLGPLETLQR